jgi:hypothetical protein
MTWHEHEAKRESRDRAPCSTSGVMHVPVFLTPTPHPHCAPSRPTPLPGRRGKGNYRALRKCFTRLISLTSAPLPRGSRGERGDSRRKWMRYPFTRSSIAIYAKFNRTVCSHQPAMPHQARSVFIGTHSAPWHAPQAACVQHVIRAEPGLSASGDTCAGLRRPACHSRHSPCAARCGCPRSPYRPCASGGGTRT